LEGAEKIKVVFVVGPTASGKSAAAMALATEFNGEIINADSMQVYRHMDIGTAKPSKAERARIPHHLIDVADPDEDFTAARFSEEASAAIADISGRGRLSIVAGGTGLYMRALLGGIFKGPGRDEALRKKLLALEPEELYARLKEADPAAAEKIHPNNLMRVVRAVEVYELTGEPISRLQTEHAFSERRFDALKLGMRLERDELYQRINERAEHMVEAGLEKEARGLLAMGYTPDLKPMRGLGYKEMVSYINGECALDEAIALIKQRTRNYAKRQLTWFGRDREVEWFKPGEVIGMKERVFLFLREKND
jgi:tRNA dimethylallyltransferase